jgi:HCOMODA/2-hydroxy-3-carboxy-muconic semialdehyde decarboxylase
MTAAIGHEVWRDIRLAARALARHQLVHAYGHVSARLNASAFVVTPGRPLGRVRLDTALIACAVDGPLPAGALPEVAAHQAIYRARGDVGGICRFQSHHVTALSAVLRTPRALNGSGAYFAAPPLWNDPMLVRDRERADGVAAQLADARAIVLRGNGAIAVGATVREAACHAYWLEDAARVELAACATSEPAVPYTPEQASQRAAAGPSLYDRMWEYLLDDDFEEASR